MWCTRVYWKSVKTLVCSCGTVDLSYLVLLVLKIILFAMLSWWRCIARFLLDHVERVCSSSIFIAPSFIFSYCSLLCFLTSLFLVFRWNLLRSSSRHLMSMTISKFTTTTSTSLIHVMFIVFLYLSSVVLQLFVCDFPKCDGPNTRFCGKNPSFRPRCMCNLFVLLSIKFCMTARSHGLAMRKLRFQHVGDFCFSKHVHTYLFLLASVIWYIKKQVFKANFSYVRDVWWFRRRLKA